jgi:hypothetical protein
MKIFYQDDIDYFNNCWDQHINTERSEYKERFHRLNKVIEIFPHSKDVTFFNKLKPLEEISNLKVRNTYMLQYEKGSYAELHSDNKSNLTWVTLLYKSNDLDGGEILLRDNQKIQIKKLNIGESYYYDQNIDHGVSEVMNGIRRVLIVWMEK